MGFFQVDREVPEQLHDHFSEFSPLFVLGEVPENQIPEHMKEYKAATGRKTVKGGKKTSRCIESQEDCFIHHY